jgi:signal peptidase II
MTRKFALCLAVACGVLLLDLLSKVLIVAELGPYQREVWLGGLITLQLVRNPGAAFGVGASYTIIIAAIAVGTIVFILRAARRLQSPGWAVVLGLLLGGATGNLSDRIFRAPGPFRGYVIDWIKLPLFPPTFNLADTAITFGAIIAVVLAVRGIRIEGPGEIDSATIPHAAGDAERPQPGEQQPGEQQPGEQLPGEQLPGEQLPGEQRRH